MINLIKIIFSFEWVYDVRLAAGLTKNYCRSNLTQTLFL